MLLCARVGDGANKFDHIWMVAYLRNTNINININLKIIVCREREREREMGVVVAHYIYL